MSKCNLGNKCSAKGRPFQSKGHTTDMVQLFMVAVSFYRLLSGLFCDGTCQYGGVLVLSANKKLFLMHLSKECNGKSRVEYDMFKNTL